MDLPATQVLDCSSDDVPREQVGILSVGSTNYPVLLGVNKIGRHPGCHIVINHNTVSKEHAEIEAGRGNDTFICDLRSANRTVINNRCLRPGLFYQLNDGNVITMGQIKATYKVLNDNEDVSIENSMIPATPAAENVKNKERNVIPDTPDSSLNNSSTCESDNSVIPGTQREKSNVFRLPSLPAQRNSKNHTANVSADAAEKINGISLDENELARTSENESQKEEVSIFDKETESYSQGNQNESQAAFDIHDAETQTFVAGEEKGGKASKGNEEEKIVEEIRKSMSQEETLNPSQNSNSSGQNLLNVSLPSSPVNIYVGDNDERSDTEGSIILIRADDFNDEFNDSNLNDLKKQSGESIARGGNSKDGSVIEASSKVNFNVNIDSNNDVNTDIYDVPTQCIDKEKSKVSGTTMYDDCETDEEGVFEDYCPKKKSKSPGKSETKDDSETDEEGIFEDYCPKKKSKSPGQSETKDDSETDEEGIFQSFIQKDKKKEDSKAKQSKNSSIEESNGDDDIFDALTQKISSEEQEAIKERNKSSNLSGSKDPVTVLEEDVDFSTAPTQIPSKDDQRINIESQPTQILEFNGTEPAEKASNMSSENNEHNNIDYEMAPTQRIDEIVETSRKAASEKQTSRSRRKTYRRIKKPAANSEDAEETLNDNIETNLRSVLNETSNNDEAMEHSQMSSQTLRNVLESTQEVAIEKSPGTNSATRNKRSARRRTRTVDTNDSVETNLKSILNETSNNDTEEHSQLSSQTLLNVLESTQEAAIEKSPKTNPETKSKRSLRKELETADKEVNQKKIGETKDVPAEADSKEEHSRSVQLDSKGCGESVPKRLTSWLDDEVDILAEFPPVNISGTLSNPVTLTKPVSNDLFKGTEKPGRRTAAKTKRNIRRLDKSSGKRDSPVSTMNRDEGEPYRIVKYSLGGSSSRRSSSSLDLDPEIPGGSKKKTAAKVLAELSEDERDLKEIKNIAERMLAVKTVYGSSNTVPIKEGTRKSVRKSDTVLPNKLAGRTTLSMERQSSSLSVSVRGNNMINSSACNKLDDERSSVFQVAKEAPLKTIVNAQERNLRAKTRSKKSKMFDENVSSELKGEKSPLHKKQLKVLIKKLDDDKQWNSSFLIKDESREVWSESGRKSSRVEKRKENKNIKTKLSEPKKDDEPGLESQEVDEILTKWSNTKCIKTNEKEETDGRKCPSRKSKRSNVTNIEKKNEVTTEINNESVDTNNSTDSNDLSRSVIFEKPTKIPRRTRATKQSSALSKSLMESPKLTESITMAQTQVAQTRRGRSASIGKRSVDEKSANDNKCEKEIPVALYTSKESVTTVPKKGRGRARKRKLDEVEETENLADTSIDSSISNISTASANKNNLSASILSLMSPSKRRQRILFTGVTQDDYRKVIQKLGGTVTESPSTCTVLVTDKVRRTFKFLCAMARPVPIVSVEWLIESEKSGHFLDMESYILHDHAAELKFQFNLRESLERAQAEKLLKDYDVLLTPNVAPPSITELKEILKNCGARSLLKPPTTWNKNTIVISREDDLANARKFLLKAPKNVPLVSPEFILTGILRHEVNFDEHRLTL